MNLVRSSIKLSLANAATAVVTFAGIAFFANWLSPEELGVFFLFRALVGILAIPADFGIRGAVEKRISEGTQPGQMLTTAFSLKAFPVLFISGGVLAFGQFIDRYVGAEVAVLLVAAIVGNELYQFSVQIISGELRVGETAVLRLTHKVIWVVVGYALLQYGFGVFGLVYGLLAGYAVPFLWAMHKRSTPFRRPSMDHVHSLTTYSRYNFVSAVSGLFYSWMDVLVIGLFLTSADVGAYEVAWRVTGVVVLGSMAISRTIFPQVSRWDAEQAVDRIENLIPQTITPTLLVAVPSFFGTLLFAREILTFVFGSEYAVAWLVLIVLMGEKIFQSVHLIIGRSLKAIDHPELAARAAIAAISSNLVLNFLLIWQVGLIGAAAATVLSFGINTVLCIKYLSRFLTLRVPWNEVGWVVGASVGMSAVLFGLRSVVPIDTRVRLVAAIALGAVVYVCLLLLSPTLRRRGSRTIELLRSDSSFGESTQGGD